VQKGDNSTRGCGEVKHRSGRHGQWELIACCLSVAMPKVGGIGVEGGNGGKKISSGLLGGTKVSERKEERKGLRGGRKSECSGLGSSRRTGEGKKGLSQGEGKEKTF